MKKWRAPKKTNKKAWKLIAAGDIWWDKRAIRRKQRKDFVKRNERIENKKVERDPFDQYDVIVSDEVQEYIKSLSRTRKKYIKSAINSLSAGPKKAGAVIRSYGSPKDKKYYINSYWKIIRLKILENKIYLICVEEENIHDC